MEFGYVIAPKPAPPLVAFKNDGTLEYADNFDELVADALNNTRSPIEALALHLANQVRILQKQIDELK